MRVLLALDERNDPGIAAAYVLERFGSGELEIDVVTVVSGDASTARRGGTVIDLDLVRSRSWRRSLRIVKGAATALHDLRPRLKVRTHIEQGEPVYAIGACARRFKSDVILIETGKRVTFPALRASSVESGLLQSAPCAVEVIKPYAASPRSLFNVLAPIPTDRLASFPLSRLAALHWPDGTRLKLLGLVPAPPAAARLESTAYRLFEQISAESARLALAMDQLLQLKRRLAAQLPSTVEIHQAVVPGTDCGIAIEEAERHRASLIVTCIPRAPGLEGLPTRPTAWMARDSGSRLAARANCSVLVLPGAAAAA